MAGESSNECNLLTLNSKRFLVGEVPKCPHISILLKVEVGSYISLCLLKWIEVKFQTKEHSNIKKQDICHLFGYKNIWIWDSVIKLWCSHIHQEANEQTGSQRRFFSGSSEVVDFFFLCLQNMNVAFSVFIHMISKKHCNTLPINTVSQRYITHILQINQIIKNIQ